MREQVDAPAIDRQLFRGADPIFHIGSALCIGDLLVAQVGPQHLAEVLGEGNRRLPGPGADVDAQLPARADAGQPFEQLGRVSGPRLGIVAGDARKVVRLHARSVWVTKTVRH